MRIAIVTDYHNKTGIGKQNYQLYRALRDIGHDAEIIHLVSSQGFKESPKYGVNIHSSSFLKGSFWDFRRGLREHLSRNIYDVVLLWHQGLSYLYPTVSGKCGSSVLSIADLFVRYPEYSPWWDIRYLVFKAFFLSRIGCFENVVFNSKFTAQDFERITGSMPKRWAAIHIGTTASPEISKGTKNWSEQFEGRSVVLQVGSFDKRKNAQAFFRIAQIFEESSRAESPIFVRIGKTPESWKRSAPSNMAFLQGLSEADLFGLYEYAKVFVFTSLAEWYWMPVVEARMLGVPVVSTKISDMAEIFSNDELTTFVENPNPESFIMPIKRFLSADKIGRVAPKGLDTLTEARHYADFFASIIRKPINPTHWGQV